jgi:hypothetical protein
MIDTKIFNWLMDNADAPIRYRIAREFLRDEKIAKDIEEELIENPAVTLWLKNLKPQTPPQHWSMEHGSFDFCLENALPKIVQLGLHGGLPQVKDALEFYLAKMRNIDSLDFQTIKIENPGVSYRKCKQLYAILTANLLSLANMEDESAIRYMLGSLDEMYNFVQKKIYDIYLSEDERRRLTRVPKNWKSTDYFINPDVVKKYGFSYPIVYDIMGMYRLYDLKNPEVDKKINAVISYISTDEFHLKITDGYGILVEEDGKYHGMGWDPKYPGWFDLPDYMETGNVPKLLFFSQYISKYPAAEKTKWFSDLLNYIEKYRTEDGTYLFPGTWLKESTGYAVQGYHMSFGENRRKKNWREIESTFYVQLLLQNL